MAHDMLNPFRSWATVVDCGDIANSLFDKFEAVQELGQGLGRMASRVPKTTEKGDNVRLITIGGDHTISKLSNLAIITQLLKLMLTNTNQPSRLSELSIPCGERWRSFILMPTSTHGTRDSGEVA